MSRLSCVTSGPDDTRSLGEAVAAQLRPGDVVSLSGELGAGKTCFVQGAARGLGVTSRVTSPTFTLVRPYDGDIGVVHVDVYRLNQLHEFEDLGDEVLDPERVTFVEWGDAVARLLPPDRLEVELRWLEDDTEREVSFRCHGAWGSRESSLTGALAPWLRVEA